MTKKKNVVTVTGATGFVGRHVVERLLKEPDIEVRAMVHSRQGALELEPPDLQLGLLRHCHLGSDRSTEKCLLIVIFLKF